MNTKHEGLGAKKGNTELHCTDELLEASTKSHECEIEANFFCDESDFSGKSNKTLMKTKIKSHNDKGPDMSDHPTTNNDTSKDFRKECEK